MEEEEEEERVSTRGVGRDAAVPGEAGTATPPVTLLPATPAALSGTKGTVPAGSAPGQKGGHDRAAGPFATASAKYPQSAAAASVHSGGATKCSCEPSAEAPSTAAATEPTLTLLRLVT